MRLRPPPDHRYADERRITYRHWASSGLMFRLCLLGFLPTKEMHRFSWRTFTPLFWRHWQPRRVFARRYR